MTAATVICNGEQLSVMCTNGNSDDSGGGEQISVMCMMVPMWFPHGSSSYVASDSAAAGVPVLKKLKTDGGSAATADADASETDAEAQAIASDFVDYLNEVFRDSAPCATIAHSALHASFEAPSSTISSVYATAVSGSVEERSGASKRRLGAMPTVYSSSRTIPRTAKRAALIATPPGCPSISRSV